MPETLVRVFRDAEGRIPLLDWLNALEKREPKTHIILLDRIRRLQELGNELRRPEADILRSHIYELRAKGHNVHRRVLYFFYGPRRACLSHGLKEKKEGKVPSKEIDAAIANRALVLGDPDRYTTDVEDIA